MRLRRLELTRYGRFTDQVIDFGDPAADVPDLHIVYGPNEAGKSTLFAAWLDLLYGIHPQSPFNFLHPYTNMRLGARIELAGGMRDFARLKRPQGSLLDEHDRPLPEAAILSELGGIDRDAYRTMFSLDDETLEKGGESILKAQGDLGQLLFSGSSGLADLSRRLDAARGDADAFYRLNSRSGGLQDRIKQLDELRKERDRLDTQASRHAELAAAREREKRRYDELTTRRGALKRQKDKAQRFLNALPRLGRLREQAHFRATLADLPPVPADWSSRLPSLLEDDIRLAAAAEARCASLEAHERELSGITLDETAIAIAARYDDLVDAHARALTASKDLPRKRDDLDAIDLKIGHLRRELGREDASDPQRLLFRAATADRLRRLIEAHSGLAEAGESATEELANARRKLAAAKDAMAAESTDDESAEATRTAAALTAAMAALQASDHGARARLAARDIVRLQAEVGDALAALLPWKGTADDLVPMAVPDAAQLKSWETKRGTIEKLLADLTATVGVLDNDIAQLAQQQTGYAAVSGVVTEKEAQAIRSGREAAWSAHKAALERTTAEQFEAEMRRDDAVGAARFLHSTRLANLDQIARDHAAKTAERERRGKQLDEAKKAKEALDQEIATALSPDFPRHWDVPQLRLWLEGRARALAKRAELRDAEGRRRDAGDDATRTVAAIRKALLAAGAPCEADADEDTVRDLAETVTQRLGAAAQRRLGFRKIAEEVAAREGALQKAVRRIESWDSDWKDVTATTWLGDGGLVPGIEEARAALKAANELSGELREREVLSDRIAKMEADERAFTQAIGTLAAELGVPMGQGEALAVYRALGERIQAAFRRKAKADDLERRRDAMKKESGAAEADMKTVAAQKAVMTAHLGVTTLLDVSEKLQLIDQRAKLDVSIAELRNEITEAVGVAGFDLAAAALEGLDAESLKAEWGSLETLLEAADGEWNDALAAYREASGRIEAIGGDPDVAILEARRKTVALQIEDEARRYVRLRAGLLATEAALRLYRETHRSSMMARASDALKLISRGAYTKLASQPGKEGEILIATRQDGRSKNVTEMSKGTRFQLYLALRAAGYFEFVAAHAAVPFVADDILETFDDFRAEETFRLFSQMAGSGQVIYLTHHKHLCVIAGAVCPQVRIHTLQD